MTRISTTMAALAATAVLAVMLTAPAARADYIDHFANPKDIGVLKLPRTGTTHVLVVPVIIDDLPFEEPGGEQAFLDEANAFYAEDNPGWGFTSYYTALSLGRFHPVVTVADPVHFPSCPQLGTFQDCDIPRGGGAGEGDLSGAASALGDSIRFLDTILTCATAGPSASLGCTSGGGVDMKDFDTSGPVEGTPDGVADGVVILSNATFPGIALPVADLAANPLFQQLAGPFPALVYDGVQVGGVAIAGRETPPEHATFVSVHELGHLLGWCDLYNESGSTTDMPYTLMGGWYYEDPGSLVDGFSRMAAGFAHVVQVAKSGTYTLERSDQSGTILKVGTGDEFFTVELRRKVDGVLDGDLSVPFGVVVERVRLARRPSPNRGSYLSTLSDCVNCRAFDNFLSIEQADGRFDLENGGPRDDEHDLFHAGDEIAPSTDTAPRSLDHEVFSTNKIDGTPTGITIRVVDADSESATVEITTPDVADPCAEISPYCGDLQCVDGECGAVQKPATPPRATPPGPSCGCTTAGPGDAGALAALVFAAAAFGRRRRRS